MMSLSKSIRVIATLALALAGASSASAAPPAPSGSSPPGGPVAAAPAPAKRRYPSAIIERPAVVPLGVVLSSNELEGSSGALRASSGVAVGLPAGIDVSFGYQHTMSTRHDRVNASIGLDLRAASWLTIAARAGADYQPDRERWGTMRSGLHVKITAGRVALWVRPEQVELDLEGPAPLTVTAPVSLGLQLARPLWVQVDADLQLAELRDSRLVRVEAPVAVALSGVIGLSPSIDLQAGFGADVGDDGEVGDITWRLGLRCVLGG